MTPRDWNAAAGQLWFYLTEAAERREKPTYGDAARVVGTSPLAVGRALDLIKDACVRRNWPPLTCIVVRAHPPRVPGSGCGLKPDEVPSAQRAVFTYRWGAEASPFAGPEPPPPPGAPVVAPSSAEIQAAVARFDATWGGVDEVLYKACADYSDATRRSLMTRWILIDRSYSAGTDRLVTARKGTRAVDRVSEFAGERCRDVVDEIVKLGGLGESLTAEALALVVAQHGRLCNILSASLMKGGVPRSFVSKLLHFHCPIVPIYDDDCRRNLERRVPRAAAFDFARPAEADAAYFDFCRRFLRLYEECNERIGPTTVKDLDALLWLPPGSPGVGA